MAKKLDRMSAAAYAAVVSFLVCLKSDLKQDERGLSGIVVAVLLILVAVLAIVMLWGSLKGWLSDLWAQITGAANSGMTGGNTL